MRPLVEAAATESGASSPRARTSIWAQARAFNQTSIGLGGELDKQRHTVAVKYRGLNQAQRHLRHGSLCFRLRRQTEGLGEYSAFNVGQAQLRVVTQFGKRIKGQLRVKDIFRQRLESEQGSGLVMQFGNAALAALTSGFVNVHDNTEQGLILCEPAEH